MSWPFCSFVSDVLQVLAQVPSASSLALPGAVAVSSLTDLALPDGAQILLDPEADAMASNPAPLSNFIAAVNLKTGAAGQVSGMQLLGSQLGKGPAPQVWLRTTESQPNPV